jgi:hypothetical protein
MHAHVWLLLRVGYVLVFFFLEPDHYSFRFGNFISASSMSYVWINSSCLHGWAVLHQRSL